MIAAISLTLLSMLLAVSCAASGVLPATSTPPQPVATTSDLMQSVQIVQRALVENRPELLRLLIGDEGVSAEGFAMGARYEGYNNSDEIIAAFSDALEKAQPICVGFVPDAGSLPDKAILVYRGLALDWSHFDLSVENSEGVTIQLFNLPEGWRFVYITPFDFDADLPIIGPLQDCPSD